MNPRSAPRTGPDVVLITPRALDDGDHGAAVRSAQLARTLATTFDVALVQPATKPAPRDGWVQDAFSSVITYVPEPLRARHTLHLAAAEGRASWEGLDVGTLARIRALGPSSVFWADAVQASAGMAHLMPEVPQIVEFANDERRRYGGMARGETLRRRAFFAVEAVKAGLWQRRVVAASDVVVTLADADADSLGVGQTARLVVPNGWERVPGLEVSEPRANLLAVGYWGYGPNRDGLRRFLTEDWPRTLRHRPDAVLRIVGRGGEEACAGISSDPSVVFEGWVSDLADSYAWSSLVLAPARSGGGSQLKVAGALQHARAVVGPAYLERERMPDLPDGAVRGFDDLAAGLAGAWSDWTELHATQRALIAAAERMTWAGRTQDLRRRLGLLLGAS